MIFKYERFLHKVVPRLLVFCLLGTLFPSPTSRSTLTTKYGKVGVIALWGILNLKGGSISGNVVIAHNTSSGGDHTIHVAFQTKSAIPPSGGTTESVQQTPAAGIVPFVAPGTAAVKSVSSGRSLRNSCRMVEGGSLLLAKSADDDILPVFYYISGSFTYISCHVQHKSPFFCYAESSGNAKL